MGKMHKRLTALLMAAAFSFSMLAAGYSVKPEPGTTFTLMTWNVRYGAEGTDAQREQIAFYDADITLLQETDFGVRRSGRVNQAEMYAEGIYDYYLYGKDDDYDTGTIGTSLLTDGEIAERDDYNNLGQIEMHNGYFHADVEVNGVDLSIYNVHLNYLRTDWRAQQLYELALEVDLAAFGGLELVEATTLHHEDPYAANSADAPETVAPAENTTVALDGGRLAGTLPAISWSMIRLARTGA